MFHVSARCLAVAFIFCSFMELNAQTRGLKDLKQKVTTMLGGVEGNFAVACKDLSTGEVLLMNETRMFHAASTMKTPVMIEVFKQARQGKFAMEDSMQIVNEFRSIVDGSPYSLELSDDSEPELYRNLGGYRTIRELVKAMITVSSNLATNMLIEKVGADKVNKTMREMGINDIKVLRGVEDSKAFERKLNNVVTAEGLMQLFELIASDKAGTKADCEEMISILVEQQFNEIIPAALPPEVTVAHKTGSITGVEHDSGIVILPDGRKYILVLLSDELRDRDKGISALSEVSSLIYQALVLP